MSEKNTKKQSQKQRLVPLDIAERKQILINEILKQTPIRDLARSWGTTPNEICAYIRAYDLRVITNTTNANQQARIKDCVPNAQDLEKELTNLYVTQGLTTVEIGNQWKTHSNVITFFLRAFNISIRTKGKISLIDKAKHQQTLDVLKNDLYRMYIDENKSPIEIAQILNLTKGTISKYLKTLGISDKNAGKRFINHKHSMPLDQTELVAELKELYLNQQMSLKGIGKKWGVDLSTISKNLKKFGIQTRKVGRRSLASDKLIRLGVINDASEIKQCLTDLYQTQGLSPQEIAHRWSVSRATILNYMKIFGVPRKDDTQSSLPIHLDPNFFPKWDTQNLEQLKDQLESLYVNQKKSMAEIAAIFNVSIPTIKKYLSQFGFIETENKKD
jgi:transposase